MGFKEIRKKKWFSLATNIYILVLTFFVVWMLFFDTNSILIHYELHKEIQKLEKQKDFLQQEIAKDQETIEKLSDKREMEKFARETYYLKKPKEEIYLIEYQDSIPEPPEEE